MAEPNWAELEEKWDEKSPQQGASKEDVREYIQYKAHEYESDNLMDSAL